MKLDNQDDLTKMQKAIISNLSRLKDLVQKCGYNPEKILIEEKMDDLYGYQFLQVVIPHHQKNDYDIVLRIDGEITLFFYEFHSHYAVYDEDTSLYNKEVKRVFKEIKLLLTLDIVITEFFKDTIEYRKVLEVVDSKGKKKNLGGVSYPLRDTENYKNINKVVTKINFRENS